MHTELDWRSQDGLTFYAQEWRPEAPPRALVCLVHGLGEHSGRYAHVAAALNQAGYALLAFDLRGHGRSGGPRGHTPSFEALMEDIDLLLQQGGQRFSGRPRFLYGHSLGGSLVLNYVLHRRPALAGVIATSPLLRVAFEPPPVKVLLGRIMSVLAPAFAQPTNLETKALSRDPEVVHAYENDPLVHDLVSARLFVAFSKAGQWAIEHAAEFSLPLLLVHGDADRITSASASREFASKVPGDCTLKIWEGFYHETHNEPQKAEVLAFMVDWLHEHTPAGNVG
jgi:alpha-beta hydrolase superfamily lysophospholipase